MQYSEEIVSTKKLKTDLICFWKLEGFLPPNDIKSARLYQKDKAYWFLISGAQLKPQKES